MKIDEGLENTVQSRINSDFPQAVIITLVNFNDLDNRLFLGLDASISLRMLWFQWVATRVS